MNSILQLNKTVLDIGLTKEYKFFQISDAHISYVDENSSETDIADSKRSREGWAKIKVDFATQFGELCDERYDRAPEELFELLAQHAIDIGADALILSGDIMDRVTESNLRYLENYFAKYPLPIIYCPGNHDSMDEYGAHRQMYDRLGRIVKNPEYDSYDFGEFKIVTIDNGTKELTDYQLETFKKELSGDKKILLVIHAPIRLGEFGEVMGKKISRYFLVGSEGDCESAHAFVKLIEQNDDKLIAVLAGHIHTSVEYQVTERLKQITTSSALIGYGREIIIK
jgi:DNA repair exonuclease SbcCD nuclease subunit